MKYRKTPVDSLMREWFDGLLCGDKYTVGELRKRVHAHIEKLEAKIEKLTAEVSESRDVHAGGDRTA